MEDRVAKLERFEDSVIRKLDTLTIVDVDGVRVLVWQGNGDYWVARAGITRAQDETRDKAVARLVATIKRLDSVLLDTPAEPEGRTFRTA